MAVKTDLDDIEDKQIVLSKEYHNPKEYLQVTEVNDQKKDAQNTDIISVDLKPQKSLDAVSSTKSAAVGGKVVVVGSENVIIGNKVYFNGPVRIQKIKKKVSGSKTSSVKDEKLNTKATKDNKEKTDKTTNNIFEIRTWQNITYGVSCIGTVSIIVVILSNRITHYNNDDGSVSTLKFFYDNLTIILIEILFIHLILLTIANALLCIFNPALIWQTTDVIDEEELYDLLMRPIGKVIPSIVTPEDLKIVYRSGWYPEPVVYPIDKIRQPVPLVIIAHTATGGGNTQRECVRHIQVIQSYHKDSQDWDDIGYNFLVGGDGAAYCGRGWDYLGAHTQGYNKQSIGIGFIGTFIHHPPPKRQLEACKKLLKRGVALGKLAKDYKLLAHRQVWATQSPGDKLFDIIRKWPHFVKDFNDISKSMPGYLYM